MKMDTPTKAERFWDRTASRYDREEESDKETYLQIIEKTKSHVKPAALLLDFGCGTGLASNAIAGAVAKVHAIDISSRMIEIAKAKAVKLEIQNIEYWHTTVFDDKLKAGSYDLILCFYMLHLLDDPALVIKKLYELLKPGGSLISVTPCMGEKPIQGALFSIFSSIGITPPIKRFKRSDLESLMKLANFNIDACERLAKTSNQYYIVANK